MIQERERPVSLFDELVTPYKNVMDFEAMCA